MSSVSIVPGTQGYAERAAELIGRYESIAFEDQHRLEMHLMPARPGRILDVGAGTGSCAAWFAARGHHVVAVEPVREFRAAAAALHPAPAIEWLDDALPCLATIASRGLRFDLVMLSAVWMHLDLKERETAMPRLAGMLVPQGVMLLSLRHGPVPVGRRMFEVSGAETIALARRCGLRPILQIRTGSIQEINRAAGVTWTRLAFRNADADDP
jgi:2-polyprenyl-3-methyl-5-hydroxy-6-metoxy-1,4-benzoquinol methylase